MSPRDIDEEITAILDARAGRSARTAGAATDDPRLLAALDAADLAWESAQAAPPLADDPVAAMLGLVPDPELSLDGKAASSARKKAKVSTSELADRLSNRGWTVSTQDVFAWENGSAYEIAPALVRAVAEELDVDPDALVRRVGPDPERERLHEMFALPAFQELANRWARLQGTTFAMARSALQARSVAAVHRGSSPDPSIVMKSLETLVSALEEGESKAT